MFSALLASRLFGPVASVIAVILLAATVTQCVGKNVIDDQRKEAVKARDVAVKDLAQCRTNAAQLSSAVDEQNAAVAAWKAESERRLAEATEAVRAAQAASQGARKRAEAVLARRGSGDLCVSAEGVLRGREG